MKSNNNIDLKLLFLIVIALIFLSTNSILCRMALITQQIDAVSFTFFRIVSGAIFLLVVYFYKYKKLDLNTKTSWISSFMLFLYAITFSFSYENMPAGIGTLILFAVVQLTMIFVALFYKEKLTLNKIIGILLAFCGLVYLLYPKEEFNLSFEHTLFMIISGIAWGFYTILGKKSNDAFSNTKDNFIKASILITLFMLLFIKNLTFDHYTLFLAIFSGVITSALGYVIWYLILPKIEILTASVLQLFTPVIAIILSILFLNEVLSLELIISSFVILFGIFVAILRKRI